MWPFKRKPPPTSQVRYAPIDYQVGDKVVCVGDRAHLVTHQKLLSEGDVYEVRELIIGPIHPDGYGGPWCRVVGVMPIEDAPWSGSRFKKVLSVTKKQDITEQVMQPAFTPTEVVRERAEAGEIYK